MISSPAAESANASGSGYETQRSTSVPSSMSTTAAPPLAVTARGSSIIRPHFSGHNISGRGRVLLPLPPPVVIPHSIGFGQGRGGGRPWYGRRGGGWGRGRGQGRPQWNQGRGQGGQGRGRGQGGRHHGYGGRGQGSQGIGRLDPYPTSLVNANAMIILINNCI